MKKFVPVILILLTVLISYGQTLRMYFWQDDYAVLFKLQHPMVQAGSFGIGYFGDGPYKYSVTPFYPFYQVFKLNPEGYLVIGFLLYFMSALTFYLFSSELLNKKFGLLASLVYSAGYIGMDTMLKVSNSWQTSLGLITGLLSFWGLIKFFHSREFKYYLLSLLSFWFSFEFIYIRSHSIIFPILVIDLLYSIPFTKRSWRIIARQLPFWLLFYHYYLTSSGDGGLVSFILSLIKGQIGTLTTLFATIGNVIIPNSLQSLIPKFGIKENLGLLIISLVILFITSRILKASMKFQLLNSFTLLISFFINRYFIDQNHYWYRSLEDIVSGSIGLYFTVIILSLAFLLWKKFKDISKLIFLGYLILSSQIFGYYIKYQTSILPSIHRYLSYSIIGYSLIYGAIIYLFFQTGKKLFLIPLLLVLLPNLFFGFRSQSQIVNNVSIPAYNFYHNLLSFVPKISRGSIFYFDVSNDPFYQKQFDNFFQVGSMPNQTALAVYYGVDRYDLKLITNKDEFISDLSNEDNLGKTYTFYYGEGLLDTSDKTHQLLSQGSNPETLNINNLKISNIQTLPLAPMSLNLKLNTSFDLKTLTYKSDSISTSQKQLYLDYLASRQDYYSRVSVKSLSEWKYQEARNAIDNNLETSWRGHRIYWNNHHHDQLTLDLGNEEKVGALAWVNWSHTLTPTKYTVQTSVDGQNWTIVKRVVGKEIADGSRVIDRFDPTQARFVRMDITSTLSDDSPALSEIEVIEAKYRDIDFNQAFDFIKDPFDHLSSADEANQLLPSLSNFINLNIVYSTNEGDKEKLLPVYAGEGNYELFLDQGGTKVNSITIIPPNMAVKINVENATIYNLSLDSLKAKKLIKIFNEN